MAVGRRKALIFQVTTRSPTINLALMMTHWHTDCGVRQGVADYGVTIGILRRECFWKP
ncbi:hypothetical protein F383_11305 [Gossypium arboreum]|uniref:Uncharacterized protein n=1 Tax=Gossypium arboreum TaxID=29729 RepID=A0A0B0NA23_GOSAR|nr:hypothetical protein F383_11305 [Gossypium arboreum]